MPQLYTTLQTSPPKVISNVHQVTQTNVKPVSGNTIQINPNTSENSEIPSIVMNEVKPTQPGILMPVSHIIKGLVEFLSSESVSPLWNYEDITAKGIYTFFLRQLFVVKCFLLTGKSRPKGNVRLPW